ncbi:hypothetical protein Salmi_Mp108 (mitochondrion) [Salvia miltiorrhiza]|uniref:Uncharacterized protein n=1 Tax=Salvia miltiorrhiza TaxID=226208 RepID=V9P511_SALMI|nr:hypothetical protein Salmi_Mp108 [Salvia miltiorrhiza]AGU16636.1 hypothetical protein Salmi_Mp108 [Salvia miltiorrhiza]
MLSLLRRKFHSQRTITIHRSAKTRIRTRPLSSGIPPSCMSSGVLAEIKWANYSLGLPSVRPERLRIQMRKRKTRCPGRVFEFSLLPKPLFSTPTPSPSSDTRDSNPRYKL